MSLQTWQITKYYLAGVLICISTIMSVTEKFFLCSRSISFPELIVHILCIVLYWGFVLFLIELKLIKKFTGINIYFFLVCHLSFVCHHLNFFCVIGFNIFFLLFFHLWLFVLCLERDIPLWDDKHSAKLCLTLAIPWAIAHQALLSMGFSRQEYWNGLPSPSPGGLTYLWIEPRSPTLWADALAPELHRKPPRDDKGEKNLPCYFLVF